MREKATATSQFGVSRRESHDSSAFYARFAPPELSSEESINRPDPACVDEIFEQDARKMSQVASDSVALVVTSPPYFAGKEYEAALGVGGVPKNYLEYLELLRDVFAECKRVLEPGGRIAVNVANLGRKPYRSLAADVIGILQDDLKLLLRGEILWVKGKATGGSCAWGSFQSAANPVLRDISERIIVASKGRFDRAMSRRRRAESDLPSEVSISKDEFMESTMDVWQIQPESASRVKHPAPFPVELPERLIHLYTYANDLVLDPFMGSGSTGVAAVRTQRYFVGYDTDPQYIEVADARVKEERMRRTRMSTDELRRVAIPATRESPPDNEKFQARGVREGRQAKEIAHQLLKEAGFVGIKENQRLPGGVEVNFAAEDEQGHKWFFDISGAFTSSRAGLRRTDTLWKALGKAGVMRSAISERYSLVFLTTDLPVRGSAGEAALLAAKGELFYDAIEMLTEEGFATLSEYASGGSMMRSSTGSLDVEALAED